MGVIYQSKSTNYWITRNVAENEKYAMINYKIAENQFQLLICSAREYR